MPSDWMELLSLAAYSRHCRVLKSSEGLRRDRNWSVLINSQLDTYMCKMSFEGTKNKSILPPIKAQNLFLSGPRVGSNLLQTQPAVADEVRMYIRGSLGIWKLINFTLSAVSSALLSKNKEEDKNDPPCG